MDIYKVPEDRRYWVVRADGGKYFDHFIKYRAIALGHLDELDLRESKHHPYIPNYLELEKTLKNSHESQAIKARRTSTHFNQVKAFISEMKVGDWVLTVGSSAIGFGRVIGLPRLDKKPLPITYDEETGRKVVLEYNLRREVIWGPQIKRDVLPFGLLASLKANQTLFNIDHHWDAIYHSLYPVFKRGNDLYLSARINTENKIKNNHIVSFFSLLNEIEVIAKEFDKNISIDSFESVFSEYVSNELITITTKAEFHSPGEVWNVISELSGQTPIYVVLAYSMLFGNHKLGFDGLLDIDTRHKLYGVMIDRMNKNNIEHVTKNLELTIPNERTEMIELGDNDEKI
jgi:hypothetical protein